VATHITARYCCWL